MKHYTTLEQSRKLVELGLNPLTADMYYLKTIRENDIKYTPELLLDDNEFDIPCWSLGALLALMPQNKDYTVCWDFTFGSYDNNNDFMSKYHCDFIDSSKDLDNPIINIFDEDTPLEAIYNMVVWLLENGHIKTEKI